MFDCTQKWLLHTISMYNQLKETFQLIRFTDDEWRIIKSCYTPQIVQKKELILREGDTCRYVWFLSKGLTEFFI
jgi:hypothetical protein